MAPHQQKILHVAGYKTCGFYMRAMNLVKSLTILFPTRIKVIPHEFVDRSSYRHWLLENGADTPNENGSSSSGSGGGALRGSAGAATASSTATVGGFRNNFDTHIMNAAAARQHTSSPFCWFSHSGECTKDDIESFLGGHDDTIEWCRKFFGTPTSENSEVKSATTSIMVDDGHDAANNKYDYDLVVIGGGSGGMAAAKEAAALGAKVALLDYVKPSPFGTVWGLGGTCVNVGCIPKKLMHAGSLLLESIRQDSSVFGIDTTSTVTKSNGDMTTTIPEPQLQHSWDIMRDNVQNHIRGLNFKYRVRLREEQVTYFNKLGKLIDAHTIETVDKKGTKTNITTSRVLIAAGGRPSPLEGCEGADLAIDSDDVFSLQKNPGKTLCIGASYISLECAGFLAGLGHDVTVAVRSILLRGFDRECADKIGSYMEHHTGVKFKREVTPLKLEKVQDASGDQIKVTFSDGTFDSYDTVLTAIGRRADTEKLGLENVSIQVNPKNGRIPGKYEQTVCPNIYAVGDVLDNTPELTPVAIQAGITLARRLFGNSNQPMDYINICTTVFTPIEYACVGLSEDDAIAKYGDDNIEVYHREFLPLEWSMSPSRGHFNAFTKVVVDKSSSNSNEQPVLGIHFVGPNAGEVMQGFGVAMKQGLSFKDLTETVGIHPTSAEEITTLSVTKSSGKDAAAGGC